MCKTVFLLMKIQILLSGELVEIINSTEIKEVSYSDLTTHDKNN
jgi:hypothetical protein